MFYNSTSICQSLFVFTLSKISYNIIYKSNDSSSKIVSVLMCAFGSCTIWSLLHSSTKQLNDVSLIIEESVNDEDESDNDEKIDDYTKRTDISNVMNDVDRLLGESMSLGQNIDV